MKNSFLKHSFLIFILTSIYVASYAGEPWDGRSVATSFEGGDGTEGNPYQIKTAAQFAYFARYTGFLDENLLFNTYDGKHFKLTDDIDLDNKPWFLVGWSGLQYEEFTGTFDGDNRKIKQLSIKNINNQTTTGGGIGLFVNIGIVGQVINLVIESGEIVTSDFQDCGMIAGYNQGLISNCHNYAKVEATSTIILPPPPEGSPSGTPSPYVGTENGVGGIVGRNTGNGIILQCTNYGEVINYATATQKFYTGGIVGYDDINSRATDVKSAVIACVNFGKVTSAYSYVGGVIGKSKNPNKIGFLGNLGEVRTTATTSISAIAKIEVGGIVGRNYEHLQNCINLGNIKRDGTESTAITGGMSGNLNTTQASTLNIHYCYSRGTADFGISPASDRDINFKNVYYDPAITPKGYGDTNTNNGTVVNAKSSNEMKSKAFVDLLNDTQDPKPWIQCLQLNDGYPIMTFMVKAVTFSNSSTGIIVKTNGQTVKDSVWLGSKVEFSLAPHYQWELGGTTPEIMYATGDITFTKKAVPVTYTITVTSSHTDNEISVKGFVNDVEESGWGNGKPILEGSTVRLTAESSSEKYVFVAWEENDQVSPNPQYTFTATIQRNIVAKFKARYTINIESSEGGTITNDYTGKDLRLVDEGTTIHFTITPQTGYQIKKIVLKNISGENNITFSPTGYVLTLSNVSSNSEISVGFEIYTGIFDNTIQQSIVYARNHQIFVETFEPATVIGYNVMGQEIFSSEQGREETASYEVPVQGLYFVKIKQLQHSIVKKVMVQ